MKKKELRQLYKNKRNALQDEIVTSDSTLIIMKLTDFILSNDFDHIHTFLTIKHHKEIDTAPFINTMWLNEKRLYASKSDREDYSMKHFNLTPETKLENNAWGIPEPTSGNSVEAKEIKVVVTPMLCFDMNGNRVGYGKGYYDRFFSSCAPEVIKIGLCLFDPIDKIEDTNEYDFPLDFVFTPNGFYAF